MKVARYLKLAFLVALGAGVIFSLNAYVNKNSIEVPSLFLPQPGGLTPEVNYRLGLSSEEFLSSLPKEATVYRFVPKNANKNDFQDLANKLSLKGEPQYEADFGRYLLKDGNNELWMDTGTGEWSFINQSKAFSSKATNIPSNAEVEHIAIDYLKNNKLLPNDFKLQAITDVTMGPLNLSQPEKVIGKQAYFYRYLDGKPVYGVSRIIVDVGSEGEIVGISRFFKDIEAAGKVPLKPFDQAFNELKEGKCMLTTDNPNVVNATITDVELSYWEDAGSISDQPYLQPVYVFKAKGQTNGNDDPFEGIVPAVQGVNLEQLNVDHKGDNITSYPSTKAKE